jgi:hypothetical protein
LTLARLRTAAEPGFSLGCARAERPAGRLEVELFDAVALSRRALGQLPEVELAEALAAGVPEALPELLLTGDPDAQHLQLDQATERRVARQLAVELEPAELLGGPGPGGFDPTAANPQPLQRPLEGLAIRFDLGAELRQRLAEGRLVLVARAQPASQLDAEGGSGQVVVEIRGQQPLRFRGRGQDLQLPAAPRAEPHPPSP